MTRDPEQMLYACLMAVALVGCAGKAATNVDEGSMTQADEPAETTDTVAELHVAETARTAYLEAHGLPSDVSIDDLKVAINTKAAAMNEVTSAYLAARDAHPEHEAQAAARVGFLHLEFACDLLAATPTTSTADELSGWRRSAERHARAMIGQGMHPLRTAFDLGVDPWSDRADRVLQLWNANAPPLADFCRVAFDASSP